MRRVGIYITLTTDGMYADPEGGLGGFDPAEEEHRFANYLVRDAGDIVMGRGMYEVMTYWDGVDTTDPDVSDVEREFATFWKETPKHVASHGDPTLEANAEIIEGDVVEFVRRLRETDGPDIMIGAGSGLFAELAQAGLIDDIRLLIAPMALGEGKAFFGAFKEPFRMRLTGSRVFPSGNVLLEYVPA
jgi:dihydrofolate reductase